MTVLFEIMRQYGKNKFLKIIYIKVKTLFGH